MVPLPKQGCFIHQTKCPNHGNWWFEGFWILSTWAGATAWESCYSNFGSPCTCYIFAEGSYRIDDGGVGKFAQKAAGDKRMLGIKGWYKSKFPFPSSLCRIEQLAIFFGDGRQRKLAISKEGREKGSARYNIVTRCNGARDENGCNKDTRYDRVIPRWH